MDAYERSVEAEFLGGLGKLDHVWRSAPPPPRASLTKGCAATDRTRNAMRVT